MTHTFTIRGCHSGYGSKKDGDYCLPSLNQYIAAVGKNPKAGNKFKQYYKRIVIDAFRRDLKGYHAENPVIIHYVFGEPIKTSNGKHRDLSNICSAAMKIIEDALQDCGCLDDDDPNHVIGFTHKFVNVNEPFVEVTLQEVEFLGV